MSTRRKGFGFGRRFQRDDDDRQPPPEPIPTQEQAAPEGDEPPIVVYVPFRCPRCDARFPDHRGSTKGRYPTHYLVCAQCGMRFRAQELDSREFLRLVGRERRG